MWCERRHDTRPDALGAPGPDHEASRVWVVTRTRPSTSMPSSSASRGWIHSGWPWLISFSHFEPGPTGCGSSSAGGTSASGCAHRPAEVEVLPVDVGGDPGRQRVLRPPPVRAACPSTAPACATGSGTRTGPTPSTSTPDRAVADERHVAADVLQSMRGWPAVPGHPVDAVVVPLARPRRRAPAGGTTRSWSSCWSPGSANAPWRRMYCERA